MSQDGGMFSVRRHRETLGPVSHNVSAIPMPASAMKRSSSNLNLQQPSHASNHARSVSGSRLSLAPSRPAQPNFHRSSSGDNLAGLGFSTAQRPSSANFLGSMTGRKSYAPIASTPAHNAPQLQESIQRRSSMFSARPSAGPGAMSIPPSFFTTAPPTANQPVDPRRKRFTRSRETMLEELSSFLTAGSFSKVMGYKLTDAWATSPTSKDFAMLFQFLYRAIDPGYRFQRSMDAEVPLLLKQMRYPFEKDITKMALIAVGGTNWPTFLALLHWMMQMSCMMEKFSQGGYNQACLDAGYDVTADGVTFQFLIGAYNAWLSIEDDGPEGDEEARRLIEPHIQAMADKFELGNRANTQHLEALEAESAKLQRQIDELAKSAPRLEKLDETITVLEEDRVKFENYNASMDGKVDKYSHRAQLLQQEIERCEQQLREADEDKAELQRRVDEQGLSVQDIDRMNSERERLQKAIEATAGRLEESRDRTAQKEAETAAKLDELEGAVERHNSLGYEIGIMPAAAPHAHGHDHELRLRVNDGPDFSASQMGASGQARLEADRLLADAHSGYQPQQILTHDLKAGKKALQELRREISERRNAALEDDMGKMDMLDKTREALDDKYAEMETLGHRLRAAQEEFEKTKEITNAQTMASDAQIEKMEKELAKMRAGLTESVQLMEQREMTTNLEYEQLTLHSAALREELHTKLERMLNDIVRFKIHIQSSLEQYEEFVAQEVDREVEEQQAAAAGADEEAGDAPSD